MVLIYLALVFPVLMLFALLALERLEEPLRVGELGLDVRTFLDTAKPEEIETFVSVGYAEALEKYWGRRRGALAHR